MNYRIFPPEELPECAIQLPPSKSICARALIINALCAPELRGIPTPECNDTRVLAQALDTTCGRVDIDASGTAMRFLTAYYAATPGADILLDGSERMRHRPVAPLVDTLKQLGAQIEYTGEEGFPPMHICGHKLSGGTATANASVSSQHISALLLIAPYMDSGLTLTLEGEPVSLPYIDMTIEMMLRAGADIQRNGMKITVRPVPYTTPLKQAEADWSAASYWYEIEALTSGFITLEGPASPSLQGDSVVAQIYSSLGVDTAFTDSGAELSASPELKPRLILDMASTPDLVPAVTVTCVMLRIPFRLSGVESLRIKECDRIQALTNEMLRLGAVLVAESPGIISWDGILRPIHALPVFNTYNDHRMALALAPVAAYLPGIVINNAEVVSKSYPDFWEHMRMAGFIVQDENDPVPPQFLDQQ